MNTALNNKIPIKVPATVSLRSYQEHGIRVMVKTLLKNNSVYLADEQGLGKTIQTILAINTLGLARTLIIAPSSVLLTWESEICKYSVNTINPETIYPILKSKDFNKTKVGLATYVIMSYELAKKYSYTLSELKFRYLVLDEAHYVKNEKAERTKNILGVLWDSIPYRIALSGTPLANSVEDGYTLFSRMAPDIDILSDKWKYLNNFSNKRVTPWGIKWEGVKNAETLSKLIRTRFFLRRRKDEVAKDLPSKTIQNIYLSKDYEVKIPKEEKEAFAMQVRAMLDKFNNGEFAHVIASPIQKYRQAQGLAKLQFAAEFIKERLTEGSVVVFTYHKSVLENLKELFESLNPSVIDGSVPPDKRKKEIDRFQSGETSLFLGQIKASGVGITLTKANVAVVVEMDYQPAVILQAFDRLHRIGQQNPVTIYNLIVKDSLDEKISNIVLSKLESITKIVG